MTEPTLETPGADAGAPAGVTVRPCAYCGRPTPQPATGRPRLYDTAACQQKAKDARAQRRAAGGVAGDVAAAEDLLDKAGVYLDRLADALRTELTPAGVQAARSRTEAEAAALVASARADAGQARLAAEQAVAEISAERDQARADARAARARRAGRAGA